MLNVVVNFKENETGWQVAQSFVGGGLSAFAGASLHGKLAKTYKSQYLQSSKGYLFGKGTIGKAANKGLIYAMTGNASAFAYNDKKYYLKMDGRSFLYITGGGFINGFMQGLGNNEKIFKDDNSSINASIGFRYVGLTSDWLMSVRGTTKENPFDYYKLGTKINISNIKFLLYNLNIE
jgi:hypothetical protein